MALLELRENGLYCPQGNFYIDPWREVDMAIITHAHADHARWGMHHYLAHEDSAKILKYRLGESISLETMAYGKSIIRNGVKVSLHPAGHIPGSAQVRMEYKGEVSVVSGDYKTEADGVSTPFEPVRCHQFISECTFGLPIYHWEPQEVVFKAINQWWKDNASQGRCSVIYAYSLGKAQRILKYLNLENGPVYLHGAIWNSNRALIENGISLPQAEKVAEVIPKQQYGTALVLAPPSAAGTPWLKKLSPYRTAACSGWMNIRGARRRRAMDAGFVLSDHADWNGLNEAIAATGAEDILLTHGFSHTFARYLSDKGFNAKVLDTLFVGETADALDD
ncbi:ligase-associated DNA damage response exonuclease [Lunatibacter salilacus]|uniref:ligase-associated DNA damage response exonuclease n=1 Tax=Lunatibacter salilacus TaxID=2483804 RepID=UPI00131DC713|nr:ligase-associated DNA damage response exonuclease [Lunatibacter salilacus]